MDVIGRKTLRSGFSIPLLGIGTYGFGGEEAPDLSKDDEYIAAIREALKQGYTHIDTAESYGQGHTEELIASAIKGHDRSTLFITSKVHKSHLRYDDVIRSATESLRRLQTPYLDLYLIHHANPDIPLQETMRALNDLVEQGRVHDIGACNFTIEQIQEAQRHSKRKIVVNQVKYSIWAKNPPDLRTMAYCQENDIMLVAYKVFGRGQIDGQNQELTALAQKYGKTKAQIMTNQVVSKPNTVVIFSSSDGQHLKDNREALDFRMEPSDRQALDIILQKRDD